ncbi:hypothetical protein [Staphylococcus sp. Marseille-Q1834]|uniref:hypothetical protein n=1 Tax=Staphylococcus sp. Marseille-Q1834 TaxID=2866594 RepID=UPI0012B91FAE|nr:hypothetical protein [Staphylococcus sp. Marseille-Q1834]
MTIEDKDKEQKNQQLSTKESETSTQNKKQHNDDDNSIGYNGEKKTALDLEIERELLEMMENEDPKPEKQKKGLKIVGLLSTGIIAVLAIIRFINRTL